jgi:hypothetical protein
MLAASSSRFDQIASMLNNQGWLRSPNAVASAATRRTTSPKYQMEEKVISDGRAARPATMSPIALSSKLGKYSKRK